MDRKEEFRKAVRRTSKYLLSHHKPEEYYRCYSLSFLDRELHLCARCTGIYAGIIIGLTTGLFLGKTLSVFLIAFLAAPTFIEKCVSMTKNYRGFNSIRTTTGLMLGLSYSNAVILIFRNPLRPFLLAIGLTYVVLAAAMIRKQKADTS